MDGSFAHFESFRSMDGYDRIIPAIWFTFTLIHIYESFKLTLISNLAEVFCQGALEQDRGWSRTLFRAYQLDGCLQEVCERQKELVLLAEHMVLVTLDFELKVRHPHSYVSQATSELKFASEALIPVSYIILNDV